MRYLVVFLAFLLAATVSALPTGPAAASAGIPVILDNLPLESDTPPILREGRMYLPFRSLAEALGITVTWDPGTKTVAASSDSISVQLVVGKKTAINQGLPVPLDAPPFISSGRTYVPLRFLGESFGGTVVWDPAKGNVRVTSPPRALKVTAFYALGDSRTSSWADLFGLAYPGTNRGHTGLVSEIALGWYSLDERGGLLTQSTTGWQRPGGWEDVLKACNKYGLRTEMVVHVTDTGGLLSRLLRDPDAVDRATRAIAGEARMYRGVNLDFEGLGWREDPGQLADTQRRFQSFVDQLAARLKPMGLELTLSLHPPNSAYRGYSYRTLGEVADRIIVMAYDYGTRPEPTAKVIEAVEMALREVPAKKISLGISVPSENADSFSTRLGIAKRYGLGGVSLWRLGLVEDEMWNRLDEMVTPTR